MLCNPAMDLYPILVKITMNKSSCFILENWDSGLLCAVNACTKLSGGSKLGTT